MLRRVLLYSYFTAALLLTLAMAALTDDLRWVGINVTASFLGHWYVYTLEQHTLLVVAAWTFGVVIPLAVYGIVRAYGWAAIYVRRWYWTGTVRAPRPQ
jgi:hypothetical protein